MMQPKTRRTVVTGGTGFIGLNVVDHLMGSGRQVLSLSRGQPRRVRRSAQFVQVDLLDRAAIDRAFQEFRPDEVVHLGARTDFFDREDAGAWAVNTEGTGNVIAAVAGLDVSVRCVFASSFVADPRGFGGSRIPENGQAYSGSKIEAEKRIHDDQSMGGPWCIVRPASVWGPEFRAPFRRFFQAVASGRYYHPGNADVPKSLSYVGNLSFQIERLLEAPPDTIHKRTFFLADYETTTYRQWAEALARHLGVRPPRALSDGVALILARCGDQLQRVGIPNVPLTTRRLSNMRRDTSWVPIDPIRQITGPLPFTLEQGVEHTVAWMSRQGLIRRS